MKQIILESARGENYLQYIADKFNGTTLGDHAVSFDNDTLKGRTGLIQGENYRAVLTAYITKQDLDISFSPDETYQYIAIFFPQWVNYHGGEKQQIHFNAPNGLVILRNTENFTSLVRKGVEKKIVYIYFNESFLPNLISDRLEGIKDFVYHLGNYHLATWKKSFFFDLREQLHEDFIEEYVQVKLKELFILFHNLIYSYNETNKEELFSDYEIETIYSIKDVIDKNLKEKPIVKQLSRDFGINTGKMSKVFKSLFGETIYQYYKKQRIQEVKEQVTYTNKTLTEIAFDYGFTDVQHFSKNFKQAFGITPTDIRKS
ncbi:helix-turn-helix domain-containing protein [Flammeovirga agarivorans]|uniref:Helix-turn-helix transcriptional regulator n=1 Tax=Flammeovirga agarivorans TaxID=2726742 RepID=A0A7X8XV85_9BACT|nr:AraC family transcriptional regulator [Flammeovirga agarivorans]NLR90979.1 helix-turn-helix transcriptional regulator [Flammeovirga agarivorans]